MRGKGAVKVFLIALVITYPVFVFLALMVFHLPISIVSLGMMVIAIAYFGFFGSDGKKNWNAIILGIIAGCFAIVMNRDSRQSRISSYQIICLNAAQAGIDYAVWLHKHNMAFYPAVDYSESIGGTANRLRINNASNNSFSVVYPA
ncbi:MAG: hypothetical protein IJJ95_03295, partial [Spirochaetales bacterium]|nr:hypothetical protein [Spirochaetales bacterium]